ncbi:MAG: acetate kinase, partial [Ruthenibacterium sp.]
ENMDFLGLSIDLEKNNERGADIIDITGSDSRVKVLVICTNEELMIARDTLKLVNA